MVLPFVNLSGERENEYFSDGVTEEVINALANVEGLHVVARTSAFSFKGKNVNVRQIGEELNVATVLEGSVRQEGNQLRVVAQLISAGDGYHIWAKSFDRELKNVFALEDELARAIVQSLKPRLVPGKALVQPAEVSTEAHDLYLKGRYFWTERSRAIELRPGYATAHQWRAEILWVKGRLPDALAEAELAQQLDPTSPIVNLIVAITHGFGRDDARAIEQLKKTLELDPNFATARWYLAAAYLDVGRVEEAKAAIGDDTRGMFWPLRVRFLAAQGDLPAAKRVLAEIEAHLATAPAPSLGLAAGHLAVGDKEGAFAMLERGVEEKNPQLPQGLKWSPFWDPIRPDPHFQKLLRRMNID